MKRVTLEDIQKLASELLRTTNRTVGVLAPPQPQRRKEKAHEPSLSMTCCAAASRCCALLARARTPARSPHRAACSIPPFERVQLANGAVLLLMERHDVPLIAFDAVMRGGA